MSLEYAILGFLNYQPYTGYDLKKIFDASVRHFWFADQSQIYRTLSRLEHDGHVEMERITQADRPDRKVYHITDTGRAALRVWLAGTPELGYPRSAALIQVFFMGQLQDETVLALFQDYAAALRETLARYRQIPDELAAYQDDIEYPREYFFWTLTIENGIANMRANLEWAESVIRRLENGQVPPHTSV